MEELKPTSIGGLTVDGGLVVYQQFGVGSTLGGSDLNVDSIHHDLLILVMNRVLYPSGLPGVKGVVSDEIPHLADILVGIPQHLDDEAVGAPG